MLKADLEREVERLTVERDSAAKALHDFRHLVAEVAKESAVTHGWCSTVKTIVTDELGLDWPAERVEFDLTVQIRVAGTVANAPDSSDLPTWVQQSIESITLDALDSVEVIMDDDWSSVEEVSIRDYYIENVERD